MRLKIKAKNVQRLASLSALGAGAMGLGTGTAEASVVLTTVGQTVGFTPPSLATYKVTFGTLSPAYFSLTRSAFTHTNPAGSKFKHRSVFLNGTFALPGPVFAKSFFSPYGALPKGKTSALFTATSFLTLAGRKVITTKLGATHVATFHPFNSIDKYFEFQFFSPTLGHNIFGWGELTESVSATPPPGSGPDVTLVQYAFETNGQYLPPGTLVPIPEPSEAIPLALSALVLGAAGVRRWRAQKAS